MKRQCKHCGVSPMRGRLTHLWQCITNLGKVWYVAPETRQLKLKEATNVQASKQAEGA